MRVSLIAVSLVAGCLFTAGAEAGNTAILDDGVEVRRIVMTEEGVAAIDTDEVVVRKVHQRGFLGVRLVGLTDELKEHFGTGDQGVMVSAVVEGSAAEQAGLEAGDIIVEAGDQRVERPGDLSKMLRDLEEGDVIDIRYVRDGIEQFATATPEIRSHSRHRIMLQPLKKNLEETVANLRELEADEEILARLEAELREVDLEKVGEDVEKSMEKVRVFVNSPEWKDKIISLRNCAEAQKEIEALSTRVRELERKLRDR